MKKVKVCLVGLGKRGSSLLDTALAVEQAEIVAVCDRYEDRRKDALNKIKDKKNYSAIEYSDFSDVLNDSNIEAVIIATSWDEHIRMAIESMRAGKITAMEVGGAYDVEECWELVRAYEQTKTPLMFLENCCYDEFELLTTSLARAGRLGEIVHCHGAYRHDLRAEVLGGNINRHYRLENYKKRNCENYPTHELGPIAKLLDINRGNKFLSVVSVASKGVGLEEFSKSEKNKDKSLVGAKFAQGDVVNTIIKCAGGQTISLTLNTTLPSYYSREFEAYGTKGMCRQEENMVMIEGEYVDEEFWKPKFTVQKYMNNADNYKEYLPDIWTEVSEEEKKLGHGGMDYFLLKAFFNAILENKEMPLDVYDAASWMCITALSEASVAQGGLPQVVPDFTRGKWVLRKRKDVVEFPKIEK